MNDAPTVLYALREAVAWITFDRPHAMNASSTRMKDELIAAFARANGDPHACAVVLTGNGRAFCAGGDLKEPAAPSDEVYRARIRRQQTLCRAIWETGKPVIAAINGYALGGGLEMALMCDLRVAARSARLGTPVSRIGSVSTGGLHVELARVVGAGHALHLLLTGDPVDADHALRIGLVTAVFEDAVLAEEAHRLAVRIASYPPASVSASKRAFRRPAETTFRAALRHEEDLAVALREKA